MLYTSFLSLPTFKTDIIKRKKGTHTSKNKTKQDKNTIKLNLLHYIITYISPTQEYLHPQINCQIQQRKLSCNHNKPLKKFQNIRIMQPSVKLVYFSACSQGKRW